ncbi:MAG: glycosyltransferase family 2 protein [Geminicoccaceae bacterium]
MLSVVLPAFNEEAGIVQAVRAIRAVLETCDIGYEILVVDDGSRDATWQELQRLAHSMRSLRAIRFSRNFGKEAAIRAGLEAASGDAAIVLDADLQHPPELIAEMLRLWRTGDVDVVNGVKVDRRRESGIDTVLTRGFYRLFSRLSGLAIDNGADLKLLDRAVIDAYCRLPERQPFFRGLVTWLGFRQVDLHFDVAPRLAGASKWNGFSRLLLALTSIVSFSTLPLHIISLCGIGTSVFALFLGLQTLWVWAGGSAVEGFTTMILALAFIGGILMLGLGIIGQYLAQIYNEVKARPLYLVREVLDRPERRLQHIHQTRQPIEAACSEP